MIHTVKYFSLINEAEEGVFLELPCFLHNPTYVGNWISGSSASLEPSLYNLVIIKRWLWGPLSASAVQLSWWCGPFTLTKKPSWIPFVHLMLRKLSYYYAESGTWDAGPERWMIYFEVTIQASLCTTRYLLFICYLEIKTNRQNSNFFSKSCKTASHLPFTPKQDWWRWHSL